MLEDSSVVNGAGKLTFLGEIINYYRVLHLGARRRKESEAKNVLHFIDFNRRLLISRMKINKFLCNFIIVILMKMSCGFCACESSTSFVVVSNLLENGVFFVW